MDTNNAIEFKNICKEYKLSKKSKNNLLAIFLKNTPKRKMVLNNISFTIKKGETVAILGKNGMGKSTIIKLLSGISYPTSGTIITNGSISSILELNSGFEYDFTGRENIYLKCQILGLSKKEVDFKINDIISFADIGEYIDEPVRTYSSGMRARLGFAISIHIDPDILAVDEVFSVGDFKFKQKCFDKITQIKNSQNKTFILVTHSIDMAKQFCKRGLLLDSGRIVFDGDINTCAEKYLTM